MSTQPELIATFTPAGPMMMGFDLAEKAGGQVVVSDEECNPMMFIIGGEPGHAWWDDPLKPVDANPVTQIWCDDEGLA